MKRFRIIPILLYRNEGLIKTIKFNKPKYIGDPINAIKIFNDKEVDELLFLDINATKLNSPPNFELIKKIAAECFMPICYGGGIKNTDEIHQILYSGVEKIAINTEAFYNPNLVEKAAHQFGSQSIVVSIDVKKNWLGKQLVYVNGGTKNTNKDPVEYAKKMEGCGAGEILVNSIDKDGSFTGYDLDLIESISSKLSIPVIASGGAASINDLSKAIISGASAAAAGSIFVYYGELKSVLINYPTQEELNKLYNTIE